MEFRLLGPVEVVHDGSPLPLGGRRQRAVLAHLALSAGTALSADQLIDRVWADEPPARVRASLHTYVSRLRAALGPGRLETRSSGYLLHASVDEVDALRFEQLMATTDHDPWTTVDGCTQALALWRGPALGDLADDPSLRPVAQRLDALREVAVERQLEGRLACGDHGELVPALAALVQRSPLREDLWARYVLALYRCGRPAEAVAACDRARRLLADELGVEPGQELRRLYEQVLRQDPDLAPHGLELHGYRLGGVLGRGPSAVVHRALQPGVGRTVALKALHPAVADDPELVAGFAAAAQAAAAVEHPHVLPLYDCWRVPGEACLVLRLATGGTLADAVRARPPAAGSLLHLVDRLASALDACAAHGVLHARLSTDDVLVDADGEPQLSPFVLTRDLARRREGAPAAPAGRGDVRALAGLVDELTAGDPGRPPRLGDLLADVARGDGPDDPWALAAAVRRAALGASTTPVRPAVQDPSSAVEARSSAQEHPSTSRPPAGVAVARRPTMSVLSRPRHPHLGTTTPGTTSPGPLVPGQRRADSLQPWTPGDRPASPSRPRIDGRRRAALVLAGLAVVGGGAAGLALAAPWDDDPATVRAPERVAGVTTTDLQRDGSLAGRGGGAAGGATTDAQRDAALVERGPLGGRAR